MKRIALALLLLALSSVTAHADNIPPIPRPIPYNSPRPITGKGLYFVGLVTNDGDTHGPQCVPTAVTLIDFRAEAATLWDEIGTWLDRAFSAVATFQSPLTRPPAPPRRAATFMSPVATPGPDSPR